MHPSSYKLTTLPAATRGAMAPLRLQDILAVVAEPLSYCPTPVFHTSVKLYGAISPEESPTPLT